MDASKYTMKIDWEQVELIITTELKDQYDSISSTTSPPMFSYDEKENKKDVAKLKKAFKTVLGFYGVAV